MPHTAWASPLDYERRRRMSERAATNQHPARGENKHAELNTSGRFCRAVTCRVLSRPITTVSCRGSPAEYFEIPFLVTPTSCGQVGAWRYRFIRFIDSEVVSPR